MPSSTVRHFVRLFLLPALMVLCLFMAFCSPAGSDDVKAVIAVQVDLPTVSSNPLLFGYNIISSGNGMWDARFNDLTPEASPLVKQLAPTVVRFPGGSLSDLYIWEDSLGYEVTAAVQPTDSVIPLNAPPHWGTVRSARFVDSAGGPSGEPFSFSRLKGSLCNGVSGLHAAHPVGAEVRPEAREGQPDWLTNTYGTDEHMRFVRSITAQALFTVNYSTGLSNSGRVSTAASLSQRAKRAAAWVAYLNGSPGDTRPLGIDAEGSDWRTVGYWAQKRARRGH